MNTHGRSDGHGALECCDSGLERTRSTQHQDAQRSSRDCPIESNFLSNYQNLRGFMFGSRKEKRDEMVVGGIVGLGVAGPFCTDFFHTGFSASRSA